MWQWTFTIQGEAVLTVMSLILRYESAMMNQTSGTCHPQKWGGGVVAHSALPVVFCLLITFVSRGKR